MRGHGAVHRARRPAVGVGADVVDRSVPAAALDARAQLRADLAEHRLDGQDQSLAQLDAPSPAAVVVYLRLLVHPPADSMADEGADDVESLRFRVLLHRRADVAEVLARTHLGDGRLEALPRRIDEDLRLRRDLADRHRNRAVAHEALQDRAEVETDDVSLLQLGPVGDAVHDDVIDGGADHRGIGREAHRRVALEGRLRAAFGQLLFRHRVELRRRHARPDDAAQDLEDLEDYAVGPVHDRELVAILQYRAFHSVEHYASDFSIRSKTSSRAPTPSTVRRLPFAL